jgi:hypothetical protein
MPGYEQKNNLKFHTKPSQTITQLSDNITSRKKISVALKQILKYSTVKGKLIIICT